MNVHQKPILTVKQITKYMKLKLEADPTLQDVWIRGEVSNFKLHSSGHMYFTLKDSDSQLKCVFFQSHAQKLTFRMRDGLSVLARGHISIYERDGQYQLYVTSMQLDGIGSLYIAYEQLKKQLEKEGLFDPIHKKSLPRFPQKVGVVTSPTGAAIRDMITTLKRRFPMTSVMIFPAHVQGDQAVPSIVKAIEWMNRQSDIDVIILGRGGGSIEELWAFNDEKVARSIHQSNIPIISAVGHETDFTIADFVSDIRAATPTAAAELVVPNHIDLQQKIIHDTKRLQIAMNQLLNTNKSRFQFYTRSPYFKDPHKSILMQAIQRIDRIEEKLHQVLKYILIKNIENCNRLEQKLERHHPKLRIETMRQKLTHAQMMLRRNMHYTYITKMQTWQSLTRHLDALSPLKVMQRGYSLVYDEEHHQVIRSTHQIHLNQMLITHFSDGFVKSKVIAKEDKSSGNQKS